MVKLGILLIIASVVFLVAPMVFTDLVEPFSPLFCKANETLLTQTSTFSMPGETRTSFTYYCVDSEDHSRDVTGNVIMVMMGGFGALLLGGMALIFRGAVRNSKNLINAAGDVVTALKAGQGFSVTVAGGESVDWLNDLKRLRINGQEVSLDDLKSGNFQFQGGDDKPTLSETLRQIEDARLQGLITEDEYQRLREEALDKLV